MTNYTELKRLAEAAESFKPTNLDLINPNYMAKAKAAHIAFADKAPPHVTLSMIAEIDRLRTQNQALMEALKATAAVCAGANCTKSGLVNSLELARSAIKLAEGKDV